MADFITAYNATVKKWEGNYDTDPNDSGNWSTGVVNEGYITGTKCGLTAQDFKKVYGHTPTAEEMQNLTQNQILNMYQSIYWAYMHGSEINNQDLANQLFDIAVNEGEGAALKLAKETVNEPGEMSFDELLVQKLNGQ